MTGGAGGGGDGATGATGATGAQGTRFLTGTGPPAEDFGNPGDFYIDLSTGMMYGPRV
jgi:hypothetical protein